MLLWVLLLLKNYYYKKGNKSIFRFVGILFQCDYLGILVKILEFVCMFNHHVTLSSNRFWQKKKVTIDFIIKKFVPCILLTGLSITNSYSERFHIRCVRKPYTSDRSQPKNICGVINIATSHVCILQTRIAKFML